MRFSYILSSYCPKSKARRYFAVGEHTVYKEATMLILLVDNNAEMSAMLQQMLEWEGHQVIVGRSGRDGLQLLSRMNPLPDMILSDLLMPDMNGFEMLEQVRHTPAWANLPFIAVSGDQSKAELAVAQGANDFLDKPFRINQLREILGKWGPV
jgi:CheY-like chemotaxis protein